VDLVEVEVIGLEFLEADIDLLHDMLAGPPVHIGTVAHVGRDFRGNQDLCTVITQRLPDECFRLTLTIGVGGLNEIDAFIHRLPQDALGSGIIYTWAEVVGPQAND
jgi:hypothetical protein